MASLHLEAHGGDVGESLAAVPASPATRAGLASIKEAQLEATLARVGRAQAANGVVTEVDDRDDPDCTASLSAGSATSDGQRFRILRPHARGGLGAVFVALDTELHREVALKQILEKHADDPVSRQRFVAEAEITGGLEHPGVVPVYGLGTYDGGRPYYAMRFIKGDSLKEAIEHFHGDPALKSDPGRRSLELRKLLRRFLDVCNAIDYAHARGVIHRDIKPANIILGKHGETLVVDWGLAKAVGRADPSVGEQTIAPSSSGSSETLPGSALGTPAYMSPESAAGGAATLGARSDVYSLGGTLYCLLTGRPPLEGENIGEVLRRVQAGDFRPPRQLDPTLDRALEAVCKKAMAHRPADRYASPTALAEDVERWMADEPLSAWREPLSRRARRWARRNRTAVAMAAAALVAGVIGLSAVLVVQTRAKADIARALRRETSANAALAAANEELGRSQAAVQARYELAAAAIKTFHTGVIEDFLLKEESFKEVRDRLLKSASDFYGKLGALLGRETDPASRRSLAAANFELAELTGKVGRAEEALAAHRAVLAAREALAAEPGADAGALADLGRSLTAVAGLLAATGKTDEAVAAYRRSESLLAGPAGADASARAALAACRTRLGVLLFYIGKNDEALAAYRQARADQEALAMAPDASNDARRDLADTIHRIGLLAWRPPGTPAAAEAELRTALAIRKKLSDGNPAVTDFRNGLAESHISHGAQLMATGKLVAAEAEIRRGIALQQKLADDYPAVTLFCQSLAGSRFTLGVLLYFTGKAEAAEAEYRQGLAIYRKLADDHPAVTGFFDFLASGHHNLGLLLQETGKPAAAEAEYRQALALSRKLADDHPNVQAYTYSAANTGGTGLSVALRRLGRPAEARELCDQVIAACEVVAKDQPERVGFRSILAESHLNRSLARRALSDPVGAAADARRAVAVYDALPSRSGEIWFLSACAHAALAGLADQDGSGVSAAEAAGEAETAVAMLHKAVAMGYRIAAAYRTHDALDPLRDREDFRLLLLDLAFPAEPFAAER